MRYVPRNAWAAKNPARRLKTLCAKGLEGLPTLSLGEAQEAVARMFGYDGLAQLQAEIASRREAPSPPDGAVDAAERHARRRRQAAVLEGLGFSPDDAAATVEIVLPSADHDEEVMRAKRWMMSRVVDRGELEIAGAEAAWIAESQGLEPDDPWAARTAAARARLDGGMFRSAQEHARRVAERTAEGRGWYAVILEPDDRWEGVYLVEPDGGEADRVERTLRSLLERSTREDPARAFMTMIEGMLAGVAPSKAGVYRGALEAAICDAVARDDQGTLKVMGWLLSKELGRDHFAVVLKERHAGGDRTRSVPLDAATIGEAREAVEAMPEVQAIYDRLSARMERAAMGEARRKGIPESLVRETIARHRDRSRPG